MTTAIERLAAILYSVDAASGWQAACDAGRAAVTDEDGSRWFIGDLALLVDKQYGRNRIGEFAVQINSNVNTVKQYRRVAKFYETDTRVSFSNLSYTHFREAIALKDDAVVVLTEAAENQWTTERMKVEVAKRKGKRVSPQKLLDAEMEVCGVDMFAGTVTFRMPEGDLLATVAGKQDVRVKVYELEEAA